MIFQVFRSAFSAAGIGAGVPVFWQNEVIEVPLDAPWLYVERADGARQVSPVGSPGLRLTEQRQTVLIHVFTPVGIGVDASAGLVGEIQALLCGAVLPGPPPVQVDSVLVSPGPPGEAYFSEVISVSLVAYFSS